MTRQDRTVMDDVTQATHEPGQAPIPALGATIFQDLRYALRMMLRSPGFTAVAVISLSLGIGANTAVFSAIDALLLRSLPVAAPAELVAFHSSGGGLQSDTFSYSDFKQFRGRATTFSSISAILSLDRANVKIDRQPGEWTDTGRVRVGLVSGNYFSLFGVAPALGRTFTANSDGKPDDDTAAVISDECRRRWFGSSPDVLGRTVKLNGNTFTIVAVAPRGFSGDEVGQPVDIWMPIDAEPRVMIEAPGLEGAQVRIAARLKPGTSMRRANAEMTTVWKEMGEKSAGTDAQGPFGRSNQRFELQSDARGVSQLRQGLSLPLDILMIVVSLVLLIACGNVANLLLARSTVRQGEVALRLSLGAGRGRILRQLLTESILLALISGAVGLVFAYWGTSVLETLLASGIWALKLDLHPDHRALILTATLGLSTAIIFGLLPAFRAAETRLSPTLQKQTRRVAVRLRMDTLLVVAQVAFSIVLLMGAVLFVRTLRNLKSQDLGFDRQNIWMIWTAPAEEGKEGPALAELFRAVQEKMSSMPGVLSVSPSSGGLLSGASSGNLIQVPGYVPSANGMPPLVRTNLVAPGFFRTVGMRLIAGREFSEADSVDAHRVAIINQSVARHYFGGQNPLGKHFGLGSAPANEIEVVGIARDAKDISPYGPSQEMIYLPYRQQVDGLWGTMCIAVRTSGQYQGLGLALQRALHDIDPNLPILGIDSVEQDLDKALTTDRLVAWLAGVFGMLAVVLAVMGVYGVMSYAVARRTGEIGIRMALGATRVEILGMVLKGSMRLVLIGIAIGLPATLLGDRLVSSLLFGIKATDISSIALAVSAMVSAGIAATLVPAWRAAKVDPMVALRCD